MLASIHANVSDWISVAGFAVAVVSLVVAFVQGNRAKHKAEAVQRQTAGAILLFRMPDLENVELKMRNASEAGDNDAAKAEILEWRRIAPELQSLLQAAEVVETNLDGHLEISLGLLDIALQELAQGKVTTEQACRALLQHASPACALVRKAALDMMMAVEHG